MCTVLFKVLSLYVPVSSSSMHGAWVKITKENVELVVIGAIRMKY